MVNAFLLIINLLNYLCLGTVEFIEKPFKLYRIRNIFSDNENVTNLEKELNQLQFSPKMNDIFSLSQTKDLFIVQKKKTLPLLQKYLKFLEQFRKFLSEKLNVQLDSKISVSSSKYSYRGINFFLNVIDTNHTLHM